MHCHDFFQPKKTNPPTQLAGSGRVDARWFIFPFPFLVPYSLNPCSFLISYIHIPYIHIPSLFLIPYSLFHIPISLFPISYRGGFTTPLPLPVGPWHRLLGSARNSRAPKIHQKTIRLFHGLANMCHSRNRHVLGSAFQNH